MGENLQTGPQRSTQPVRAAQLGRPANLIAASQVARETEVRHSANGVSFATFGETGVADLDLDRMLETVPTAITAMLNANTYYFVPLALRETAEAADLVEPREPGPRVAEPAMVASAYTDELGDASICHRNVDLPHGKRGVFISTRLMSDRFALSFEFFINVAHAFVDQAGIPAAFSDMVWQQAVANVRGETSLDAWESRNLAFGRPANAEPEPADSRKSGSRRGRVSAISYSPAFNTAQRSFSAAAGSQPSSVPSGKIESDAVSGSITTLSAAAPLAADEKERELYLDAAFSDAVAIYLLSLALDFDYSELREREYPLLAPSALAARLRLVAELYPPNPTYEFAVKYRRRA